MKKNQLLQVTILVLLVVILALLVGLCFHEMKQDREIKQLQEQVFTSENNGPVTYSKDAFNYLAIGNSITLHEISSYWWDDIGMAATTPDKDFFSLVTKHLEKTHGEVVSYAYNFHVWEITDHDRVQTYSILEPYLSPELDLITLQLSENLPNVRTFTADLKELVTYLQEACPKAQIIMVDDFWSDDRSALKKLVSLQMDIPFADLTDIRFIEEYMCGMNTIVYGEDGEPHVIDHQGVANHPGDKGMQIIADRIIALLDE